MDQVLNTYIIAYLNSQNPRLQPMVVNSITIRKEYASADLFDIIDKQQTIVCMVGQGSATYQNAQSKTIVFIDYENFIDQLPEPFQIGKKRCDFIAYDSDCSSFILFHELSASSSSGNKLNRARQQLHSTLFLLSSIPEAKAFLDRFPRKECIFSNKMEMPASPLGMASAFGLVRDYLPSAIVHSFQPISKLGFRLIETPLVVV